MLSGSLPGPGVAIRGALRSEVKEEARRRPPGDTSGEESADSPRHTPRASQKPGVDLSLRQHQDRQISRAKKKPPSQAALR
jgi:hypothetical protein